MEKILLLGGTGALGEYLIENLINEKKYSIYVTSRKKHNNFENVHYLLGNAKNKIFLDTILKNNFDCIVDFMIWKTNEFNTIVHKLVNKTNHYIFLS